MNNLPIHLTTHHLHLSDPLRQFVAEKIAPVKRFANDALSAEIVLRRHGGAKTSYSASARVALPGRDVHGRARDEDLYAAIGQLVTKLARRLRKRKTRLGWGLERAARAPITPPRLEAVVNEVATPADDVRLPRDREGGQEMRVFPLRRRDRIGSATPAPLLDGEEHSKTRQLAASSAPR